MTYHESLGLGTVSDVLLGSTIGVLIAFGILMILLFVVAAYVYFAIAWQTIARKLNYKKPGLAWLFSWCRTGFLDVERGIQAL